MRLCRASRSLLVLCVLTLNVSCATKPVTTFNESDIVPTEEQSKFSAQFSDAHIDLIATDMVSVMIQVRELNPLITTIQYSNPVNRFGERLIDKLRLAGYGMQEVSADQGVNYIGYQTRKVQGNRGSITDVLIKLAGIEIRREYNVTDGHVIPASLMFVTGTESFDNIVLNENLFLQQSDIIRFESGIEIEMPDSSILASIPRNVGAGSDNKSTGGRQNAILEARKNLLRKSREEIQSSREQYRDLVRALVRFQGGQLTMGRKNKAVLKKVLADFDQSKDAIFVSSCVADGVAPEQAVERSSRIKEELVLSGVAVDLVVEKGCVQSYYPDNTVEPQTVVLIHSRIDPKGNGSTLNASLEFPKKPLVMTIPYGAGGATDYQARIVTMVANEKEYLGQPIRIVNKKGQGGRAGWSWFAESASSTGYDIASYNVPHFIAQSIKFETPYNIDTLEPIANWGADPAVLVVAAGSPFKSVADVVRFARANPGKLTVSGAGMYVGHHIALLQLEKSTNIKTNYIAEKGGAEALQQVVTGDVQAGFNNMSDAYRLGDKVRILAIADLKRNATIPTVPTFLEMKVGVDDSSVNYQGLMVPKGTPSTVIDRLSDAALKMFNNKTVINKMKESGAPIRIMDRESVINMWNKRQAELSVLLRGL